MNSSADALPVLRPRPDRPALLQPQTAEPATGCEGCATYSRYYQRVKRRYAAQLDLLAPGEYSRETLETTLQALRAQYPLDAALRVLRQLLLLRLIESDVEQGAPMETITLAMTCLAELALDQACAEAHAQLRPRYGVPRDAKGRDVLFWVVGMGKLGARELNVSSDIDLIYVYERDGETSGNADGRGIISNQEYFAQLVRHIQTLVGDTTEHGFVFRMDLALRPHGKSGPPAIALDALHQYFLSHGREWERFAWLKSRVVAPTDCIRNSANVLKLRDAVLPFVFRRYLDYSVFDALRTLHRQIREHASARCAGRPERANDVKISRGGIREIEFIVQLLQVVRGGSFPELRCRPTLEALARLARAGLMPQETAEQLHAAYVFLRRTEHRIQYLDDQQTHILPTNDLDLLWLAQSMGFADTASYLRTLDQHRERVAEEFDALLGAQHTRKCSGGKCVKNAAQPVTFEQLLQQVPPEMAAHLRSWLERPRLDTLREDALARVLTLLATTGQWLARKEITLDAALRFCDWLESLLGRDTYFALLIERPAIHARLVHVLGAAKWPLRYMLRHPVVVDELASGSMLDERFDAGAFMQELELRRAALQRTGEDDDEALMNVLRRGHHAEVFRTLARDVEHRISVEAVADDLSALADSILATTTSWCWQRLRRRHRDTPAFAIIGYGKLGGKELGYGSDLDIVFVYDDDHDDAPEVYANLVRKLITWLTAKTAEGDLYEIDTALRPNGNSGLLVTSFSAYANYQQQRGSNTAWTWEHQAITRARFVLGEPALAERFAQVRQAVIQAPRDRAALRAEIIAMRERMRQAHPEPGGLFDLKHSRGGMIDIEFATQYLVLAHAIDHAELAANTGNIALLRLAEALKLLPAGIGTRAADAYREMRRRQHTARLNEQPSRLEPEEAAPLRQAGLALWQAVFPPNGAAETPIQDAH